MLNLVWVRWCCLDSSSRSYRGTTPSRVRRTTRTACPASSSSSASSRMADGSPRSCKCSRAKPCRWTHSSLPLLMKSSRGRRCTLRMATATSTTTTLPRRRTIAWCHWQRFPGEGFPRVAWATSWAGLYYSRLSKVFCVTALKMPGWRWPPSTTRVTASATWAPGVSPLERATKILSQIQLLSRSLWNKFKLQRHDLIMQFHKSNA